MFNRLTAGNIESKVITPSGIKIGVPIDRRQPEPAVQALHDALGA